MTAIAQIALEFCRECLGWATPAAPVTSADDGNSYIADDDANPEHLFFFDNLNTVMEAVCGWCSENDFFLSTCTTPTLGEVSAQVFRHGIRSEVCHTDFGHALLAACVEANRKLKTV